MKMKRYVAPDMRQAMRQVREEQGPDAVILSNRKVEDGVEIIVALDLSESLARTEPKPLAAPSAPANPSLGMEAANSQLRQNWMAIEADQPALGSDLMASTLAQMQNELKSLRKTLEAPMLQLGWGEMRRVQPVRSGLLKNLLALGLDAALCEKLAAKVGNAANLDGAWRHCLAQLAAQLPIAADDILAQGGVVALLGSTGVGKTTTVAKLAARFALRHGRRHLALVTTDSYRIGAHEQLRTYGRMLGVPVHTAADREELRAVLNHNHDKRLVLIDTAGFSQRDLKLAEQLAAFDLGGQQVTNYLVLSATTQTDALREAINSFHKVDLRACVLTKVDEAASLGGALATLIDNNLPLAFIGDGQKVPDDLHPASGQKLVAEAVKLMKRRQQEPAEAELAFNFGGMVANAYV